MRIASALYTSAALVTLLVAACSSDTEPAAPMADGGTSAPDAAMPAPDAAMDSGAKTLTPMMSGTDQERISDAKQGLVWVNSSGGCFIYQGPSAGAAAAGGAHCDGLTFAGKDDWRLPTATELSDLIIRAKAEGLMLNYINPNCQNVIASDGIVKTEHTATPGAIVQDGSPAGARCVRKM